MSRKTAWLGPALVAATAALLVWWGWGKWFHPLVDFGREIYLPWQLSRGHLLYRDLAYFNGPLSPYLNAFGFWLFGATVRTLVVLNLAVLAAVVVLVYRLIDRHADRLTATVGCLFFLVVFALADPTGWGNYNFAAPYSHELTHGMLLSLAALTFLLRFVEHGRSRDLTAAGIVGGLVFLTKAELFLALSPVLVLGVLLAAWGERLTPAARIASNLATLAAAVAVPPVVTFLLFAAAGSTETAVAALLGPWPYLLRSELREHAFYVHGMGLSNVRTGLLAMLRWVAVWGAALLPAAVAARLSRGEAPTARWLVPGMAVFSALVGLLALQRYGPNDLARPVPLALVGLAALLVVRLLGAARRGRRDLRSVASLLPLLWALGLLAKMPLYTRFHHYGFALAAPAALVLVVALIFELPRSIDRRGGTGRVARAGGLGFLSVVMAAYLAVTAGSFARKVHPVGEGADRFLADRGGLVVERAVRLLRPMADRELTLATLPDVSMLNFLLRMDNPTPYTNLLPPEFFIFGEREIVAAFRRQPPDLVVLAHRPLSEYGTGDFGHGFGDQLVAWLRPRYREAERITESGLGPREVPSQLVLFVRDP